MNRSVVSTALVLVMSLTIAALAGCQTTVDTNRNANATAAPSPTIDRTAIAAEVERLEREWFRAGETYDVATINRIVADDAVLVYPDGTLGTKADEVRLAESKAITVEGWEILESKVTVLSADSAFISGRSRIRRGTYKDPNATRPIDISGEYRFTDVYARRNGNWQVVASQATKILAPAAVASPTVSP